MPNHITNILEIDKNQEEIAGLMQNGEELFDFNRIIPLPKELEGTQSPAEIVPDDKIKEKLLAWEKKNSEDSHSFKQGRPISETESKELIAKYGANDWYDWCLANWGTKWNSYEVSYSDDKKKIVFDTAWSCPLSVIEALSKKFKDTTFILKYADEDIGSNCGTVVLLNGEILSQEEGDDKFACEVKGIDYEELLKEREE
jgi:hypothetical protein